MDSLDRTFEHALRRELQERYDRLTQSVAAGSAASFEKYKEMVGELNGIRVVLSICDDIKKKLTEGD